MKALSTLVVLVAGVLLCGSAPASAGIVFEDNFESHTVGTTLSANSPTIGESYAGSTYGKIMAAGLGGHTGNYVGPAITGSFDWLNISAANQTAVTDQVVTFSLDAFVMTGTTAAGMAIATFTTQGYGGGGINIDLNTNGDVWYYGSGAQKLGTFTTNQWNHVTVVADYGKQTFKITVGNDIIEQSGTFLTGANTFSGLYLANDTAAYDEEKYVYYDNVSVWYGQVPEPSALLLLATGSVLACARRKRK